MPPNTPRRLLGCVALLACCSPIFAGVTASPEDASVWRKVSLYLTKESWQELRKLPEPSTANQRARDFCQAVVRLDQQPLSESRLDDVEQRLQALLAAGGDDEITGASRYLLGRIAQIYREQPDVAAAARYYQMLADNPGPGDWGGLARVKLAVLKLYALPAGSKRARIDAVEALIPGATNPIIVRDLHRLVARGVMFFNLPPREALEHLQAADQIGGLTGTLGADQLVQLGELAWDVGDDKLSAHYYDRLREEYPRDARVYLSDRRQSGEPVPQRREAIHGR